VDVLFLTGGEKILVFVPAAALPCVTREKREKPDLAPRSSPALLPVTGLIVFSPNEVRYNSKSKEATKTVSHQQFPQALVQDSPKLGP
jgi:hypothetical protein